MLPVIDIILFILFMGVAIGLTASIVTDILMK